MKKQIFKNPFKNAFKIDSERVKYVYIIIISMSFFLFGYIFAKISPSRITLFSPASASYQAISIPDILLEVQNILDRDFISWKASSTLPTIQELSYGIVKGYVESYKDPYTEFFTPQESKQFEGNIKGSFGGIGAYIGYKDGHTVIISTIKNSPAERAGVKSGDIIISVDATSTRGMSSDTVVSYVRGDIGTPVTLEVLHKNESKTSKIKIVRAKVDIPILETEISGDVFIIHFYSFTEDSASKFQDVLKKFAESGKTKLLIDLRGNGGGYLGSAINIASFFLSKDKLIVSERSGKNEEEKKDYSFGYDFFDHKILKLGVLIDGGSASASEILAGALKDNGVATVIGEKSFGKGSVQQFIKLSDGSSVKVTVAKWFTPNGINISENGILPDVVATSSEVAKFDKAGKLIDEQLNKAIEIVNNLK
jgi:carboxyl-terminal processing protease